MPTLERIILPTNSRSFPIDDPEHNIARNFLEVIGKDKRKCDLTNYVKVFQPVISIWCEYFRGQLPGSKDINWVTLLKNLSSDVNRSLELIENWKLVTEDLEEELNYILVYRTRKFRFVPKVGWNIAEYIIARDFKYGIWNSIWKANTLLKRESTYHIIISELNKFEAEEQVEEDVKDFRYLCWQLPPWYSYLTYLYKEGYSDHERAAITHLFRRQLYREEKKLCVLLRQKLSNNLVTLFPTKKHL